MHASDNSTHEVAKDIYTNIVVQQHANRINEFLI